MVWVARQARPVRPAVGTGHADQAGSAVEGRCHETEDDLGATPGTCWIGASGRPGPSARDHHAGPAAGRRGGLRSTGRHALAGPGHGDRGRPAAGRSGGRHVLPGCLPLQLVPRLRAHRPSSRSSPGQRHPPARRVLRRHRARRRALLDLTEPSPPVRGRAAGSTTSPGTVPNGSRSWTPTCPSGSTPDGCSSSPRDERRARLRWVPGPAPGRTDTTGRRHDRYRILVGRGAGPAGHRPSVVWTESVGAWCWRRVEDVVERAAPVLRTVVCVTGVRRGSRLRGRTGWCPVRRPGRPDPASRPEDQL